MPFRWTDRDAGREECGVVYRLPPDTAAVRRAREERAGSTLALFLNDVRGARPPHLRGLRFRVVRWDSGGGAVGERDFAYGDWNGDPYGTLVANLLGSPIGLRNHSLSHRPTLFFPILYPLGLGAPGFLLLAAGLLGRARSKVG
ncbi:MAG: hypothetical protein GWM92_04165 [Gemmatimonadetes bacterium]|nr:hypothetical protein [Gemmatimonadota bacterium]NIR79246.1 hypothetical protein [Gemmatimonadota bacterium]NIT86288.1 hypothetical protein [Gemmatimonadota bacterium]NIU31766.1 hypothetical protein [Gemmatimonadota bacterium]NIU35065.1 hypothetical protein [Gemmatimonadota bacterium]